MTAQEINNSDLFTVVRQRISSLCKYIDLILDILGILQ